MKGIRLLFTLAGVVASFVAVAQGPLQENVRGEGTVRWDNREWKIQSADVRLSRDRDAVIVLRARDRSFEYRGRWYSEGRDRDEVVFNDGPGKNTHVRGRVLYRAGRVYRVELDGEDSDNNVRIRFQDGDDLRPDWNPSQSTVNEWRRGSGTVRIGDGEGKIKRAYVSIDRIGRCEIRFETSKTYVFRGQAIKSGGGWELLIDDRQGEARTYAAGRVSFRFGSESGFRGFQFSGRTEGRRLEVDFRAD